MYARHPSWIAVRPGQTIYHSDRPGFRKFGKNAVGMGWEDGFTAEGAEGAEGRKRD
jgi:hypothetical protein